MSLKMKTAFFCDYGSMLQVTITQLAFLWMCCNIFIVVVRLLFKYFADLNFKEGKTLPSRNWLPTPPFPSLLAFSYSICLFKQFQKNASFLMSMFFSTMALFLFFCLEPFTLRPCSNRQNSVMEPYENQFQVPSGGLHISTVYF